MRTAALIFVVVLLGLVLLQAYKFWGESSGLKSDLSSLTSRLNAAKSDGANLQGDLDYLSIPDNFEKEIKARFNYEKAGEHLIIIVPPQQSSTVASGATQ